MSLALCTHVQPLNTVCRWVEEEDQWELCAPALQGDWRSAAQRNWLDRAAAGIQVRTAWHATHSTVTNHSDTQQLCIQYRDMCTVTQCIHTTVTHVPHACTFNRECILFGINAANLYSLDAELLGMHTILGTEWITCCCHCGIFA